MPKKIVICFDGTWNTPDPNPEIDGDQNTNVRKLYNALAVKDAAGNTQQKWYETGVGTNWYDKISGGAFGVGLSEKIKQGYTELSRMYEDGDEVCVFGFSRGAYSARSLVGLIRNAGLLRAQGLKKNQLVQLVNDAYAMYRTRDGGPDEENARYFRRKFSREISIHCLGVWDTVGALGIPVESFDWFNRSFYQFHDTELSGIVRNAFHALAIDEHRKSYQCALWDPKTKPNQRIEQAWFCGAHSNVGGGYADNALSDIPLRWMIERAQTCGLVFDTKKVPKVSAAMAPITDSYGQFLGGAYSKFEARYFRTIGATVNGQECVDGSVMERARGDHNYRPKNTVMEYLVGDHVPRGRIGA